MITPMMMSDGAFYYGDLIVILVLGFEIGTLISICMGKITKQEVFQQNHIVERTAGYELYFKLFSNYLYRVKSCGFLAGFQVGVWREGHQDFIYRQKLCG